MAADNTQFSIAVHILVGIAKYKHVNTIQLAQSVNTSPIFIKRIVGKLAKNGLVISSRGRNGGNCLIREAKDISLLDVYQAINAPSLFAIHQYDKVVSCSISSNIQQALTDVRNTLQNEVEQDLSQISIQDMLDDINLRKQQIKTE